MTENQSELLVELLEAATVGDVEKARRIGADLSLRARAAGSELLARQIEEIIGRQYEMPIGLDPLRATKSLDELRLTDDVKVAIDDFLLEQNKAEVLIKHGLQPRHKVLLMGPPGNGKTVLAGAVSIALGRPAFMVRYDDLISKIPGETSRNLLKLFNYAEQNSCLLFFDEFDALGREREDPQETGDMKRVTSTLLVQLDSLSHKVVCFAATNHPGMLDGAIWRRFNIRLELPRAELEAFPAFMRDMFAQVGYPDIRYGESRLDREVDLEIIAYRLSPENFSDAELFVRNCKRQHVLAEGSKTIEDVIYEEVDKWANGQKRLVA